MNAIVYISLQIQVAN